MLEKAYVILAHKNKKQVQRLISRLEDGHSFFFIHIDRNSELSRHESELNTLPKVVMIKSIKTKWGTLGLVEATLNAMKVISKNFPEIQRVILLSGQDYPIKSNNYINEFLASSNYNIFMDYVLLPNFAKWPSDGGNYRFQKYFFGFSRILRLKAKVLNFLVSYLKIFKRKVGSPLKHYYGSQWWIIDRQALNYILSYLEKNPSYYRFHRYTFAPDELFFQTIILNSELEMMYRVIKNDDLHFMKWDSGSSAHPDFLTKNNFHEISASPMLFARKFDSEADTEILDLIDKYSL